MPTRPITMRGRQLGLELRRLRNAQTLSADEVAEQLGWSQSKVTRIEGGISPVTRPDLLKLLDLYRVTSPASRDHFLRLSKAAREHGWWVDYREVLGSTLPSYLAFEAEATELLLWSWATVPGILQTPEYARALLKSDLELRDDETTGKLVEARMARQERLHDPQLRLWVVLDEGVLRRSVGDTDVMREQLKRLLSLGEGVTLQVLRATGWHPGVNGAFTVMRFDQDHPDIAFSEGAAGDLFVEQPKDVDRYALAFDHLRASAASPVDSREIISAVMQT